MLNDQRFLQIMSKKKNIKPSIEEAKLRIELYNKLCDAVRDLTYDEACIVLCTVEYYLNLLNSSQCLDSRLSLVYSACCTYVFDYLYKAGQLSSTKDGFDPEIRKRITDVIISLANEHDAD